MWSRVKGYFAKKILNKYAKSIIRKALMAVAGIIAAKAPVFAPLAEQITANIDSLTAAAVSAALTGVAVASSFSDKKAEDKPKKRARRARKAPARKKKKKK